MVTSKANRLCVVAALSIIATSPSVQAACADPFGDVTGNGAVSVADVMCIVLTSLAAPNVPPSCLGGPREVADLNCDGAYNVSDALLCLKSVLGQPLPVSIDANENGCPDACDCDPMPEVCNGMDDDCDGMVDEAPEQGALCSLANANAICAGGVCEVVSCDSGYANCDNDDSTGCEAPACSGGCASQSGLDEFNGPSLDGAWTLNCVGGAPSYNFSSSRLTLVDSPFAPTPSSGTATWIYDALVDRGNQICRPFNAGTGGFEVEVDLGWTTSNPELTLGAIAVTDANHYLQAWIVLADGWSLGLGSLTATIRTGNTFVSWSEAQSASGEVAARIVRVGNEVRLSVNGSMVVAATNSADIRHIALVHTAHRAGSTTYGFGTITYDNLTWCR